MLFQRSGGSSAVYQRNRAECLQLLGILQELQKSSLENSDIVLPGSMNCQAQACEETLRDFLEETSKFHGALGPSATKGWHRGSARKAQWALSSPMPKLYEKLGKQVSRLNIEMQTVSQCVPSQAWFYRGSDIIL